MSLVSNKPIIWVAFLGKKALLTALPTVCWLLITAGEEGGCCWTPEQVPSVGLVLTWVLLQDRDGSLHGMLSPWQLLHTISGLSAKDCCWQGNITNICDQWGLHRWMESCFPFPGLIWMVSCQWDRWLGDVFRGVGGNPWGWGMARLLVELLRWWQIVSVLQAA